MSSTWMRSPGLVISRYWNLAMSDCCSYGLIATVGPLNYEFAMYRCIPFVPSASTFVPLVCSGKIRAPEAIFYRINKTGSLASEFEFLRDCLQFIHQTRMYYGRIYFRNHSSTISCSTDALPVSIPAAQPFVS